MKGKIIVIEGALDGIGKSTQFALLKNYFENKNKKVVSHHFPTYDEKQGELVMEYLKGSYGEIKNLSPYFINSLYAIDRKITWEKHLKNAYEKEEIILLDRYTTSSLIYQSALIEDKEEKDSFISYVTDYEYNKLEIKKPDIVIFLTAPFDFILDLKKKRDNEKGEQIKGDIHERDLEFLKKVYQSAKYCAEKLNWVIIECTDEKGFKSPDEIHRQIINKIQEED